MYLDLQQGRQESIGDYTDRYLKIYNRLSERQNGSDSIEAAKFIKSLLLKTREEVINSFKRNKQSEADTYLPNTLFQLFPYLERNIGDIQEALYIAVTNSKYTHSKVEGYGKRNKNNKEYPNKEIKTDHDRKNLCNYCKKEKFSFDHLKTCVQ